MNADISSSPPSSSYPPQDKDGIPMDKVVPSTADGQSIPQGSHDRIIHGPSPKGTSRLITSLSSIFPVPNGLQCLISNVSSNLGKLVPIERHQLTPIVVVVCVETAFLKWIRRSSEDVLSTIFFTFLLGSFAWPAWSHLKRMHCQLDEVYRKMEALEAAIRTVKSSPSSPPIDPNPGGQIGFEVTGREQEQEGSAPEPHVPLAIVKPEDKEHVNTQDSSENTGIPGPDTHARRPPITGSRVLPAAPHDEPQHTHNTKEPVQVLTARVSEPYAGPSVPTQKSSLSRLSPALREIKQQLEQFVEGKLQRLSHLDQSEPSSVISLRRIGVRILMSCASFSPADFTSAIGYLGPPESTLYYPTGNLQRDRIIAFTVAMDCLDDLEANITGNDTRIASKLSELAQALSDLGLHTHALTTSSFAAEIIEGVTSDNSRLDLASVLSLRASILCDLKRNDESIDAAEKAVTLCKEHRDSLDVAVPEVAYALLNHALLLCSFELKDEGAAVAFELQGEVDGNSQPDMKHISALCGLCLSITRIGDDDELALSTIEEAIKLSHGSSDADWQATLAGALLIKSKILSSMGQDEAACPISAEAITLLRTLRVERPLFSLFLADALDTHAHHLSEASRKGEAFLTSRDAVDLWQVLRISTPGPTLRRLAWALFHLAKFRQKDADRIVLSKELEVAETAVTVFREVSPLDAPGLGEALYLYADRMLELDKNQESATYAEESVQYFREACSDELGKEKYGLDLIFSLSLASACLACTERADDAFDYAKQAVQVQHERTGATESYYKAHLGKLLLDVVFRATEMDKQEEALPWFKELESIGGPGVMAETDEPTVRRSGGKPQPHVQIGPEFKKETNCWIDPGSLSSADNRKEAAPSAEASGSTPRVDKGKGREVNPAFDLSGFGRPAADEEIFSPGAKAAQRGLPDLGKAGPLLGSLLGGSGGNDMLGSLLGGLGGRGVGSRNQGGSGLGGLNMGGPALGGSGMGGRLGGMGGMAGGMGGLTDSLLSRLGNLQGGPGAGMFGPGFSGLSEGNEDRSGNDSNSQDTDSGPRTGTWSGMGIRSKFGDEGA